ncbi:MAG: SdpI family protein [Candidatus Promineifilaceae bacterium]
MRQPTPFRTLRILSLGTILFVIGSTFYTWQIVPSEADVLYRYDATGTLLSTHSKTVMMIIMPIVAVSLISLQTIYSFVEPRKANLERSLKSADATWAALLIIFVAAQIGMLSLATRSSLDIIPFVGVSFAIALMLMGNFFGKMRSNWFFGFSTSWTMESDLAWDKTHRLGGRLFFVWGCVLAVVSLMLTSPPLTLVYSIAGGILASLVLLHIYAYFMWRQDVAIGR